MFYQNIVSLFENDPEDDWVKETLAWWNEYFFKIIHDIYTANSFFSRQIPGLPRATVPNNRKGKRNVTGINGRIMDPIARAAAQRAAKKVKSLLVQRQVAVS